ncbi:MAG: YcxB family protein [bacterium]|nr:YcxB family protein [bacterium]
MADQIVFQPMEADYLLAAKAFYRRQIRSRRFLGRLAMLAGFALLLVVCCLLLLGTGILEALTSGAVGALAGMAALIPCLGLNYLLLPRRVRRLFRQSKSQHQPMTFKWSFDEASWHSEYAQQQMPWLSYHGWLETGSVYLLYLNDNLYQFVPRHILSANQDEDLRNVLVASGLPRR